MHRFRILILSALTFCFISAALPGDKELVAETFDHTNNLRKAKKLQPLIMLEVLNEIAEDHSQDMAKGKTAFGHNGFSKREKQARKLIPDFKGFAENVAFGATSGKEVVEMWKNSPGHRKNMLGNFRYIGIGVDKAKNGDIYYTQVFVK